MLIEIASTLQVTVRMGKVFPTGFGTMVRSSYTWYVTIRTVLINANCNTLSSEINMDPQAGKMV